MASSRDSTTQLVGGLVALFGLGMMASAQADTTYCELLPQRSYVALLELPQRFESISVEIEGQEGTRVVLTGLRAPPSGGLQLRYVRLPVNPGAWATSGRVFYSNVVTGPAPGPQLPFILGGVDVRPPSEDALRDYHAAGLPTDIDLSTLTGLYHAEGIRIDGIDPPFEIGRHILEGGTSLYTPLGGTIGFCRLYGQQHPAYQPRSAEVKGLLARMSQSAAVKLVPLAADPRVASTSGKEDIP